MGVFGVDVLERFERNYITCARTRAREWAKKKRSK